MLLIRLITRAHSFSCVFFLKFFLLPTKNVTRYDVPGTEVCILIVLACQVQPGLLLLLPFSPTFYFSNAQVGG